MKHRPHISEYKEPGLLSRYNDGLPTGQPGLILGRGKTFPFTTSCTQSPIQRVPRANFPSSSSAQLIKYRDKFRYQWLQIWLWFKARRLFWTNITCRIWGSPGSGLWRILFVCSLLKVVSQWTQCYIPEDRTLQINTVWLCTGWSHAPCILWALIRYFTRLRAPP
jgi:hypothetical protein